MKTEILSDPRLGILVYKNAIPKEVDIINRLESTIGKSTTMPFMWCEALVGYSQKMPEYRDCVDCKIGDVHINNLHHYPQFAELRNIYNDTATAIRACMTDYQSRYNINMEYMEAINFVRYGANQHFQVHTDHGFSYTCTVSSVAYFNDDYEGGELWFPYLDLTFKPEAGDIVMFPSTFIYAHAARPVISGVKYSGVTMFDYNDRNHDIKGSYDGVKAAATR
jgi:2OG-Fe(II) oxygenase superfamily